jgi:hypothetical protein
MRRGTSATEVIVGTAILALALVPVISMISTGTRPAAYNEYHYIAQSAATCLVDRVSELVLSKGFAEIETMAVGEKTNLQDTRTYKIDAEELKRYLAGNVFLQEPKVYLTNVSEHSASLVQISVALSWTLPGDKHTFGFVLERLLSRPDTSLSSDYTPRQAPGGAS